MKLIIGNKNYSSWSMRPWLLLKHANIAFEEVRIPLFTPSAPNDIRGYSDAGKVPVLLDGKTRCWDSLAICEYLNEQYLSGKAWPELPPERAHARAICAEMHAGFFRVREQLPMNCRANGREVQIDPALQNEIERIMQIWHDCRKSAADTGPWLFGDFSVADCMYAPVVSRFATYGIPVSDLAGAYMATWQQNSHYQHWLAEAAKENERIEMAEVGEPSHTL